MRAVKEVRVGETLIRVRGDVIFLRPVGPLSPETAQLVVQLAEEVWRQHGHSFFVLDLERAGAVPAAARRVLVEYGAVKPPLAIAMYHVSLFSRGVNALLFGAVALLGQRRLNVRQFSTESAALAWLQSEQQRTASGSHST